MKIGNILIFVTGAAIGAVGTYFAMKKYVERRINDEINEMDNYYRERCKEIDEEKTVDEEPTEKLEDDKPEFVRHSSKVTEVKEYEAVVNRLQYNNVTRSNKDVPYEIEDELFASNLSYEHVFCTYFTDDEVVVDTTTDEQVTNYLKEIGGDNIDKLIDSDDPVIYVANDKLGRMYEITREDHMSYEDYVNGADDV